VHISAAKQGQALEILFELAPVHGIADVSDYPEVSKQK
jgi:hypothetical protein